MKTIKAWCPVVLWLIAGALELVSAEDVYYVKRVDELDFAERKPELEDYPYWHWQMSAP
ncbi:MAG: hypothetical protein IH991_16600, partial [Planctomycetes bacterium]|nr:hypothetical protein [Planctomycetota bacterium]